ncbi:MAG: S53 family peptidase [Mycobacterium sp.]|nr:S53 family peptidase [Mycobacterium sp.]
MPPGRHPSPAVVVVSALSVTAALGVAVADQPSAELLPNAIGGPYARLLAESADLGPARSERIQVTAALNRPAEPVRLIGWAEDHALSVRWRDGDNWAVIEGSPGAVARAFGVAVRDYRARAGSDPGGVFAASPQQPEVPAAARSEVSGLGRILGYTPSRGAMPQPPRDVPDGGLLPSQLLNAYNAAPLVKEGATGKGETVVVFAFDGFRQQDLDTFADTFGLPRFSPEVIGGMPERVNGEANMDLQVIHAIAPDAKLVLANARESITPGGRGPFEDVAALMDDMDARFPGAIWSFSIGWGCDRLFAEADFAPVRQAMRKALAHGTTAFNATGDLAGMECRRGESWSAPPSPDDVGVDAVASLPEMTAVGGTKLSTDGEGHWLSEQSWYNTPLIIGTAGGASTLFERPDWQTVGIGTELPDRRLVPDVSAVSDPFTGVRIVFNQEVMVGGGTSQAAPIWAGLTALMNDKLRADGAKPIGELNPVLYRLAKSPKLASGLRDINLGGNAISISGTVGYDMVTGLGTPNVDNLVRSILLARAGA